jgi:hypothetical protein
MKKKKKKNLTASATLVLLRSVGGHTAAWLRVLLWAHFQHSL